MKTIKQLLENDGVPWDTRGEDQKYWQRFIDDHKKVNHTSGPMEPDEYKDHVILGKHDDITASERVKHAERNEKLKEKYPDVRVQQYDITDHSEPHKHAALSHDMMVHTSTEYLNRFDDSRETHEGLIHAPIGHVLYIPHKAFALLSNGQVRHNDHLESAQWHPDDDAPSKRELGNWRPTNYNKTYNVHNHHIVLPTNFNAARRHKNSAGVGVLLQGSEEDPIPLQKVAMVRRGRDDTLSGRDMELSRVGRGPGTRDDMMASVNHIFWRVPVWGMKKDWKYKSI